MATQYMLDKLWWAAVCFDLEMGRIGRFLVQSSLGASVRGFPDGNFVPCLLNNKHVTKNNIHV